MINKRNTLIIFLVTIAIFIFAPFIWFGIGAFLGFLIKITIGDFIVKGFTFLNCNISKTDLPILFGTIAVVASFFKNEINLNKERN